MKILVYGAGVLGCNLARNLFLAGKDVTPGWYLVTEVRANPAYIATGEATFQALLWKLRRIPNENGDTHYEISLGLHLPGRRAQEQDLYDDDALLHSGKAKE